MAPVEFEVAETVNGVVLYVRSGIGAKVRVGVTPLTLKLIVVVPEL